MQQKSEMPEGWAWAEINQLGDLINGDRGKNYPSKKDYVDSGIPFINAGHLLNGKILIEKMDFITEEKYNSLRSGKLAEGDIIYCLRGTLGKCAIFSGTKTGAIASSLVILRLNEIVSKLYVYYFLISPFGRKLIKLFDNGTAQPNLSAKSLSNYPVPLPPLSEQHRIISAIEALSARLDATNEKLDRVLQILKNFRESVLTCAFNGRLTENWRVMFQNSKMESESFEKHNDVNSIYFSENPMTTNDEVFPALPNKWCWATIEQLASNEPRSIQSGPFGSNLLHSEFQETGVLAIGIDNVLYRSFSLGKEHRISNEKYQELKKYTARPLDVLITVMATVGRCCVVPQDIETAIITKHVYRITPNKEVISPHYLMNALSGAAIVKEQIDNQIRGQTRPGINGKILKETSIPLPPLPEQKEIVRRVDSLFAFADSIEAKVAAAREKTEKLRQSILAKAFSGELVETEAEIARRECRGYETAEGLLERIKEERGKGGKKR